MGGTRARVLALGLIGAPLASCGSVPIRDVSDARLHPSAEGAAAEDIDEAIWRAGRKLGWVVQPEGPGELMATLRRRSHVAVVEITHDGTRFDIRYQSSRNLDQQGDRIHENYNVWVERLAGRIREEPIRGGSSSP